MRLKRDFHRLWFIPIAIMLFGIGFACGLRLMPLVFADSADREERAEIFITVMDDNEKTIVKTSAPTVRELLGRLNITYEDYDDIEPSLDTELSEDNFYVTVSRARPVLLQDGQTTHYLMSTAQTPREMFESTGLTIYDDDNFLRTDNNYLTEIGLATVYTLERGETFARLAAEAKAQAEAEAAAEAARLEAERLEAERRAAAAAKPSVRPEWSTCATWASQAGVSDDDLAYALTLIYHESGCRVEAQNSRSGAYGIPQALPGSKMASAGADWQTNPVTQIRWMSSYVTGRYGGWQQALDFWNSHHWY